MSRRLRWWLGLGVQALLIVVVVLAVRAYVSRDLIDGPFPDIAVETLDGEAIILGGAAERPQVIHVWATWCPICRFEDGEIQRLAADHPVVTIAMQSGSADDVRAHLAEQGSNLVVANDPDGRIAAALGVRAVPSTFLLDTHGQIRYRKQGYAPPGELRLRLWWLGQFD
ncbi:MAG: redoxin family protein [Thioalkalivibrionaceae bacterium]